MPKNACNASLLNVKHKTYQKMSHQMSQSADSNYCLKVKDSSSSSLKKFSTNCQFVGAQKQNSLECASSDDTTDSNAILQALGPSSGSSY